MLRWEKWLALAQCIVKPLAVFGMDCCHLLWYISSHLDSTVSKMRKEVPASTSFVKASTRRLWFPLPLGSEAAEGS